MLPGAELSNTVICVHSNANVQRIQNLHKVEFFSVAVAGKIHAESAIEPAVVTPDRGLFSRDKFALLLFA